MKAVTTNSVKETQALAASLAATIKGGEVLCLNGELGAGKTTFIQGFARALGIKQQLTSPTFVLQKIYPVKHPNIDHLVHVDAYRTAEKATPPLDLRDHLGDPRTVTLIEWPNNLSLPKNLTCTKIQLKVLGKLQRKITIV